MKKYTLIVCLVFALLTGCERSNDEPRSADKIYSYVKSSSLERSKKQRQKEKWDLNAVNDDGLSLLVMAVYEADTRQMRKLLKLGADPNLTGMPGQRFTAMGLAAQFDSSELLAILMEYGGDVNLHNVTSPFNPFPIFNAGNALRWNNVAFLLDNGANIDVVNSLGQSLLSTTAGSGHWGNVLNFLKRGADPTLGDNNGLVGDFARDEAPNYGEQKHNREEVIALLRSQGYEFEIATPYSVERHIEKYKADFTYTTEPDSDESERKPTDSED